MLLYSVWQYTYVCDVLKWKTWWTPSPSTLNYRGQAVPRKRFEKGNSPPEMANFLFHYTFEIVITKQS